MTLNDVERRNRLIALILRFLPPISMALHAHYITVVEDRPIMYIKYCLPVPVFHFWPKLMHPAARCCCDSWTSCWIYSRNVDTQERSCLTFLLPQILCLLPNFFTALHEMQWEFCLSVWLSARQWRIQRGGWGGCIPPPARKKLSRMDAKASQYIMLLWQTESDVILAWLITQHLKFPPQLVTYTLQFMKLLKNYLRSTMTDDRLTGLALLYVHPEINVDVDEVVRRFVCMPAKVRPKHDGSNPSEASAVKRRRMFDWQVIGLINAATSYGLYFVDHSPLIPFLM